MAIQLNKHYEDLYFGPKVQKITQRLGPCTCGCKGRDPWHVRELPRRIRDIRRLDSVEKRKSNDISGYGGTVEIIAEGTYSHPSGETRKAGLSVLTVPNSDRFVVLGWTGIKD